MAALAAIVVVLAAIFKKPGGELRVEGEVLERAKSPALWARIEELCARLQTPPPDHIIGGIDDNFFVTEHPVHVGTACIEGRTLFVSLSLLKRLDKPEAEAIFAHEMAHFSGGDTLYSKQSRPCSRAMARTWLPCTRAVSRPVFYFMLFYWSLFSSRCVEPAGARAARRRDRGRADLRSEHGECAVQGDGLLVVPRARGGRVVRAQASALAARHRAEHGRGFHGVRAQPATRERHRVRERLSAPLRQPSFARGPARPHRSESPAESLADVVVNTSVQTWFSEIGEAERIEAALWQAYEQRFRAAHEESLAYRYLPSTPDERAHVERFFPAQSIAGKDAKPALAIDCMALHHGAWPAPITWASITSMAVQDEVFHGKVLVIQFRPADGKAGSTDLRLKQLADSTDAVLAVINRYYGRALTAKQLASSAAIDEPTSPPK